MNFNQLPKDVKLLLELAGDMTYGIGEKQEELGLDGNAEAELLASLAAALYARCAYLAIFDGSKHSSVARSFLGQARRAYYRTEQQLRRRMSALITEISRRIDDDDPAWFAFGMRRGLKPAAYMSPSVVGRGLQPAASSVEELTS